MSEDVAYNPQIATRRNYKKSVSVWAPFGWLGKGMKDFALSPFSSLIYGALACTASLIVIGGLFYFGLDYILLPALAGFMVIGPAMAVGLYEKARRRQIGQKTSLTSMFFVRAKSPGQILFVGVMLMLLVLLWLRSAFLLYALFFGFLPFPGFDNVLQTVLTTREGWMLLGVGSFVGGLFAAFGFAISAFSIPMLLERKTDAFTAMGTSWAVSWNNMSVSIVWGAIVIALFALSLATALLGLIIVFPILGYATWHAYVDMAQQISAEDASE